MSLEAMLLHALQSFIEFLKVRQEPHLRTSVRFVHEVSEGSVLSHVSRNVAQNHQTSSVRHEFLHEATSKTCLELEEIILKPFHRNKDHLGTLLQGLAYQITAPRSLFSFSPSGAQTRTCMPCIVVSVSDIVPLPAPSALQRSYHGLFSSQSIAVQVSSTAASHTFALRTLLLPTLWYKTANQRLMRTLADHTNRSASIGDFEQVAIRITKVERYQRFRGTSPLHGTQKESNMAGVKMRHHLLKRHRGQKAQVGRTRSRMLSL